MTQIVKLRLHISPPLTGELINVHAYSVHSSDQPQLVAIDHFWMRRAVEVIDGGTDRPGLSEPAALCHAGELCSFSYGEPNSHPRLTKLTPRDPSVPASNSLFELVLGGTLRLDGSTLTARLILSRARRC